MSDLTPTQRTLETLRAEWRRETLAELADAFTEDPLVRPAEDATLFAAETRERIEREMIADVVAALRERQYPDGSMHVAASFIEEEFRGS